MNKASTDRLGFGFESPNQGDKDEWLTPPRILQALGEFDLDPCAPIARPWPMARHHFTIEDDGLKQEWTGRVWLNSPYGQQTKLWIERMARHNDGVALIFARTETATFDLIFRHASAYLFLSRRLQFHHVDGTKGKCATAPSVLVAFDRPGFERYAQSLPSSSPKGAYFGRAVVVPQAQENLRLLA